MNGINMGNSYPTPRIDTMAALTDYKIRNLKPGPKPYKVTAGRGLYLLIKPNSSKYWRYNYKHGGRQNTISLGVFPDVLLEDAEAALKVIKGQLAMGIDPSLQRRIDRLENAHLQQSTFRIVALEWHVKQSAVWAASTATTIRRTLEMDLFPWLGDRPIKNIGAPELLAVLRKIESRGAHEKATRCREIAGRIFRYAVATGRAERDPAADLKGALTPNKTKHHACLTAPREVAALLRAIDGFQGSFTVRCALQLAPLVFVRPGELRHAEWSEIDFDAKEWRLPAHKMKMRDAHIVPLSRQAIEILKALEPLTGRGKYIFPSIRSSARPMSENTLNAALRRLGYGPDEMTAHGFRGMASTLMNECGWPHEVIERQLAHSERNKVAAAYNHAGHLPKRREMMQWWSDYLEGLAKIG